MSHRLAYERQRRDARRRTGMCLDCVAEADRGVRCAACRIKKRARNERRKRRLLRAGLCGECGQEPRQPWRTLGERCAQRKTNYYAQRRAA